MYSRFIPAAALALLGSLAHAESPGPTDPAGPRLDPAETPRPGTGEERMDEQIRRGTLVDPREATEQPPPGSEPPSDTGEPDRERSRDPLGNPR